MANKNIKAETKINLPRWTDRLLWKLGADKRKRILKFFGLWTMEDELFEILSEEIRNEIDAEILKSIKIHEGE